MTDARHEVHDPSEGRVMDFALLTREAVLSREEVRVYPIRTAFPIERKSVQAPKRRRPRRIQRKIDARAGRLHHDPNALQPFPTRRQRRKSRAFVSALEKQARDRFDAIMERRMLYGDGP